VAQSHMPYFMADDPGKLGLVVGRLHGAAVDVQESSRQREGVDGRVVDGMEFVRELLSRRLGGQQTAQSGQVSFHPGVPEHDELLLGLFGRFPADLHVLFRREEVDSGLQRRALGPCDAGRRDDDERPPGRRARQPESAPAPLRPAASPVLHGVPPPAK